MCVRFPFLRALAPVTSLPSTSGSFGTKSVCLCTRREPLPLLSFLQILPIRRRFTVLRRTETFQQWWNCNRGWLFHGAVALKRTNFFNLRLVPSWVTNLVLKSFSGPLLLTLTCYVWKSSVSLCFQSLISTHTLILKCNIYWRCQFFLDLF